MLYFDEHGIKSIMLGQIYATLSTTSYLGKKNSEIILKFVDRFK